MTSNGRLELRNAGKFWKSIIAKQKIYLSMQLHLFFTHIAGQSISELRGLKSAKNQQFGESESFGLNTAKIFLHHVQRMGIWVHNAQVKRLWMNFNSLLSMWKRNIPDHPAKMSLKITARRTCMMWVRCQLYIGGARMNSGSGGQDCHQWRLTFSPYQPWVMSQSGCFLVAVAQYLGKEQGWGQRL